MRARYSAFVTHAIDFIVASTHSRTRKEIDLDFVREWSETSTWHGLEVLETKVINDEKAYVSFEAHFTQKDEEQTHREKSLFEREDGEWRFVSGGAIPATSQKVGRNEPCPCGSGKKYKKCCGA